MSSVFLVGGNHITESVEEIKQRAEGTDYDKVFAEGIQNLGRFDKRTVKGFLLQPIGASVILFLDILRIIKSRCLGDFRQNERKAASAMAKKKNYPVRYIDAPPFHSISKGCSVEKTLADYVTLPVILIIPILESGLWQSIYLITLLFVLHLLLAIRRNTPIRDKYMADVILEQLDEDEKAIAIIGRGHIPGVFYHLENSSSSVRVVSGG